jgi:hypothetical protein
MVGRLSLADRLQVARVVVCLAEGRPNDAAKIYTDAG